MENIKLKIGLIIAGLSLVLGGLSCDLNSKEIVQGRSTQNRTKKKSVNGIEMAVKMISPQVLADQSLRSSGYSYTSSQMDSAIASYRGGLNFTLTLTPRENGRGHPDLMMKGVNGYKQYADRMLELNFRLNGSIELKAGQETYVPAMVLMENTFGLTRGRTFNLLFADADNPERLLNQEKYDLVFHDPIFGLGTNHFVFHQSDLHPHRELN